MRRAILIATIALVFCHPAKADVASCMAADQYGRLAQTRIDFASKLRVMGQPFQDEIAAAKVWQDKQAQAEVKCSTTDRDYYETLNH